MGRRAELESALRRPVCFSSTTRVRGWVWGFRVVVCAIIVPMVAAGERDNGTSDTSQTEPEVGELKRRIDDLESQLAARQAAGSPAAVSPESSSRQPSYDPKSASWHARIMEQQRVQQAVRALRGAVGHPRRNLLLKLHNYEVARSHNVSTPQVFGIWQSPSDVDFDALPDEFVLKSNGGSTGRGVLPLRRTGAGFQMLDGTQEFTAKAVVEYFENAKGVRPPFFAEMMLPGAFEALPDDVKIFAFYGEVALVLVRRMPVHANTSAARVRMLAPNGDDLGEVQRGRPYDQSVQVPKNLELMTEVAADLSRVVPLPFVRVDLYDFGEGVALGEFTPLPGDSHTFTPFYDKDLGERYDRAEARLQMDLMRGRPFEIIYGAHSRDLTVPMGPTTVAPGFIGWSSE